MSILNFEEFRQTVFDGIKECPDNWRYGQKAFNYIDAQYGVARTVQFVHNIDCFYNDNLVDAFIKCSFNEYNIKYNGKR